MSGKAPEPAYGQRLAATPVEPVSRFALWGFAAVAAAALLALVRDSFTAGLFGLPVLSLGNLRYAGLLLPVLLLTGIALGHLAVKKRRRTLRYWRVGIWALVLGYGFLLLYLLQAVVLIALLVLLNGHPLAF